MMKAIIYDKLLQLKTDGVPLIFLGTGLVVFTAKCSVFK